MNQSVTFFHPSNIEFDFSNIRGKQIDFIKKVSHMFQDDLHVLCGNKCHHVEETKVKVKFNIKEDSLDLNWLTDESYTFLISKDGKIQFFS